MPDLPLIISLFDYSGSWSDPYLKAGYRVIRVDLGHPAGETRVSDLLTVVGADILQWEFPVIPWGVLAAPPCTTFCRPGARWWTQMDADGRTERDCRVFMRALELSKQANGWWALENPPGRHRRLMNIPEKSWQFQPYEHGDPWVKQTYIWGTAQRPAQTNLVAPEPTRRTPNGKSQGRIAFMSSSWKREREKTPSGFAQAFFDVNP